MFLFNLNDAVRLATSSEHGTVKGRAEFVGVENQYLVLYATADSAQVKRWWGEPDLVAVGGGGGGPVGP